MLAANDQTIRSFNKNLDKVAGFLEGERDDLAATLSSLSVALNAVSEFVAENKEALRSNIDGLTKVTRLLVKQRAALKETLDVAPLALNNLFLAYNPRSGTLDQRSNIGENINQLTNDPALVLCAIIRQGGNPAEACDAIRDLFDTLPSQGLNRGAPFTYKQIGLWSSSTTTGRSPDSLRVTSDAPIASCPCGLSCRHAHAHRLRLLRL